MGGKKMKAVAIGIHGDDLEGGIGGILYMLHKKGWETKILIVSPNNLSDDIEKTNEQSIYAASILGAEKTIFDYNATKYFKCNEETIEKTKEFIVKENPDVLFILHPQDHHIEHKEVSKAAREAVFRAAVDGVCPNEIYSVELGPMQTMCYFNPDIYIDITSVFDVVKDSLYAFNQSHADGEGLAKEKEICAAFRGHTMGFSIKYAEALKIIKYPDKNNDFLLKEALNDNFRWAGTKMYYPFDEIF